MKIFISTSSFGKNDRTPLDMLEAKGIEVRLNPHGRKLTEEEITGEIAGIDGLIAGTEPLTRNVMKAASGLKVISRCGTGMDNVDMNAANESGIAVFRTPESPALAVAELALGLILDSLRSISFMDRAVRSGGWEKRMGGLLSGKTVGIVGMGHVGRALTKLLAPFECNIMAYDVTRCAETASKPNVTYGSLDEVLAKSDIVTVHLPLAPETDHLFSTDVLGKMKKGAIFINTSRGEIVDENALHDALKTGTVGYACLDVFRCEPYTGPLKDVDNVTMTCHVGSYAREARVRMEIESVENLLKGLGV